MEFLVFIIVVVVLLYIGKNYKTEEFKNINLSKKEFFRGDILNHEAGLIVALLAKVAKADGKVGELEAELIKHTLNDISSHFENSIEVRGRLKELYNVEKENYSNLLIICERLLKLTFRDYEKRFKYFEYIMNLAFIDGEFTKEEQEITEDIANALKILKDDYENLVLSFKEFYKDIEKEKKLTLDKAYKILNSHKDDEFVTIKANYRELVKMNHPDIITGRGESKDSIEKATKKLQEINEAYEIVKKDKGV